MTANGPVSCSKVTVNNEFHPQGTKCFSSDALSSRTMMADASNPAQCCSSENENKANKVRSSVVQDEQLNISGRTSDATSRTVSCSSTSISSVSFGSIHVREYNRSLGDCFDVSHGLAIGWEYADNEPMAIEELEPEGKKSKKSVVRTVMGKLRLQSIPGRRRSKPLRYDSSTGQPISRKEKRFDQKPTTIVERSAILQNFGYTWEDLAEAEEERARTKFEQYLAMY